MPNNRSPDFAAKQQRADILAYEDQVRAATLKAMAEFLRAARQSVLGETITAATETDQNPPNLDNWPSDSVWRRILKRTVLPLIGAIFGKRFADSIPDRPDLQINPEPYRIAYLATVADRLVSWPKTAFDQVRRELAEAELAAETIPQKRDRIGKVLNIDALSKTAQAEIDQINRDLADPQTTAEEKLGLKKRRTAIYELKDEADSLWQPDAERIARTETIGAYNGASFDATTTFMAVTGEVIYKEWLATHDTRTRHTHRIANGQVRAMAEPFTVGGFPLEFPGDPIGPPQEVINCRCTWLTIEADEIEDRAAAYEQKLAKMNPVTAGGNMGTEWNSELQSRLRGPLLRYWTRGKGAAKIRWGTPGDFKRCVRLIRKYFPLNPKGECANLHHEATGFWPGRAPGERRGRHSDGGAETFNVDLIESLPEQWRGILAPLDAPSGDGRMLAAPEDGQLQARPFPLPLMRQPSLEKEHLGAVIVGRIDNAWIDGNNLMGEGVFDLGSECGREAARLAAENFCNGVSVDLDNTIGQTQLVDGDGNQVPWPASEEEFLDAAQGQQDGQIREIQALTTWRLMSATLVANPAFAEATITTEFCDIPNEPNLNPVDDLEGVSMAVIGDLDLPLADREREWNGDEADERVFDWATNAEDGSLDTEKYGWAHFWVDSDMDPQDKTAYKLGFADLIDGKLTAVPRGIFAVAAVLEGARGGTDIPEADQEKIRRRVGDYYKRMAKEFDDPSIVAPWGDQKAVEVKRPMAPGMHPRIKTPPPAMPNGGYQSQCCGGQCECGLGASGEDCSLVAGAPLAPPAEWFANQALDGPTPLTITEDGQVFGHLATFETCHIGYPSTCVKPPKSRANYSHFNVGVLRTEDGTDWPVGKITLGTGHASPDQPVRAATAHYDNTGTAVAAVRAYEDEFGIVVAGALLPDVSDEQIAALRRSPLSGDWRQVGGNLELVAALAVNVPGFAVPRSVNASADQRPLSLVAAGVLMPAHLAEKRLASNLDPKEFARLVVTEIGEQQRKKAQLEQVSRKLAVLTASGRIGKKG